MSVTVGGGGGVVGPKFLPLYTSTLLLDRVSQKLVSVAPLELKCGTHMFHAGYNKVWYTLLLGQAHLFNFDCYPSIIVLDKQHITISRKTYTLILGTFV